MGADSPAQGGVAGFELVQDGPLCDRADNMQVHLALDAGEGAQVRGQDHPDHGSV
jgi:hypothetical protein